MAKILNLYATNNPAVESIVRFQSVKRWHMVDTTRQQTLAEHSANVAMLVMLVQRTCPELYFGSGGSLVSYALLHDVEEVFVGDIPTPTKYTFNINSKQFEEVVPREFNLGEFRPEDKLMVKLCDLADGIRFIRRYGIGRIANHADAGLSLQMEERYRQARSLWPALVHSHVSDILGTYLSTL